MTEQPTRAAQNQPSRLKQLLGSFGNKGPKPPKQPRQKQQKAPKANKQNQAQRQPAPQTMSSPEQGYGQPSSNAPATRKGNAVSKGAKRPTPKVVTQSYTLTSAMLGTVYPASSLVCASVIILMIFMTHSWHRMTLHGIGMGLVFAIVELLLLLGVVAAMRKHLEKPYLFFVGMFGFLVMIGVVVAVVRLYPNDLYAIFVTAALVVSLAQVFAYVEQRVLLGEQLEAVRLKGEELDARKIKDDEQSFQRIKDLDTVLARGTAMLSEAQNRKQGLEQDIARQAQEQQDAMQRNVETAVNSALGIANLRRDLEAETAKARNAQEHEALTYEQIHARVQAENATALNALQDEISSLQRTNADLRAQLHQVRGPASGGHRAEPPPVVTQDGGVVGVVPMPMSDED